MIDIRKVLGDETSSFYKDFEVFELYIEENYPEIEIEFNRDQFLIFYYNGWLDGKNRINYQNLKNVQELKKMEEQIKYDQAKLGMAFSLLISLVIITISLILIVLAYS